MNIAILSQGLVGIAWLGVVVAVIYVVMRASRNQPTRGGGQIIIALILVALILTSVSSGLVFINPNERGVVISAIAPKGYRDTALDPGLRFVIPFAETVERYDISRQTYTMAATATEGAVQGDDSITARTLDGQQVLIDASVIYEIDPAKVIQVHIQWQKRYPSDLIRTQSRGIIRDVLSQYTVDELLSTKRAEVSTAISTELAKKLQDNGLSLVDFVLRNVTFSTEYAASIEQKQIAQQQAEQAKLVVESKKQEAEQARQTAQGAADAAVIRAKGDADARLISAEAEAKSLGLISTALKDNPNLLNYQYITKLSPNLQVMLVPSNSPFLLPFPTQTSGSSANTQSSAQQPLPTTAPTTTSPTPVPTTVGPTPTPAQ